MAGERFIALTSYGRPVRRENRALIIIFMFFAVIAASATLFCFDIPQAGKIVALLACFFTACQACRFTGEEWRKGHVPMPLLCLCASVSCGIVGGVFVHQYFGDSQLTFSLCWPVFLSSFLSACAGEAFANNDPAYEKLIRMTTYFVAVLMSLLWGMAFSESFLACIPAMIMVCWFTLKPAQPFVFMSLLAAILMPSTRNGEKKPDSQFMREPEESAHE